MIEKETKKWIIIWIAVTMFIMIVSFLMGAKTICENSGGIALEDFTCSEILDIDRLPLCKDTEDNVFILPNITTTPKVTTRVSCNSDSMGLVVGCNDQLIMEEATEDNMQEGSIYVFESPNNNGTVVHRLVKDCRQSCTGLIFKGDNNYIADKVINQSDVLYKVEGVNYR